MKSVLLLGAYSDIGQALAYSYAEEGHAVWLAGRNVSRMSSIVADLNIRFPGSAAEYEFDAVDFASHRKFLTSLPGTPDIAVCIFGLLGDQEKAESDWQHAHSIIDTNYTGAVSILNLVAADFVQRGSGTIVGISSVAGERGRQSNFLYGSAKGAFTLYLQGLRNRLAKKGVHVLTVKPGFVDTKMTEHLTLPKPITAQPQAVARSIIKAVKKGKNTIYILWMWRYIMWIIRSIPEFIFKKMSL